jgi:hypothetical protein
MNVYFDTNIYTHIYKRQHDITTPDVVRLKAAIRSKRLRVYLSAALIEETVNGLLKDEKEALGRLRLINDLGDKRRMLNEYEPLIESAIRAYITNTPVPSPFLPFDSLLRAVLKNHTWHTIENLKAIARKSIAEKTLHKQKTEQFFHNRIWPLAYEQQTMGLGHTFDEHWALHSMTVVESITEYHGLRNDAEKRGLARI